MKSRGYGSQQDSEPVSGGVNAMNDEFQIDPDKSKAGKYIAVGCLSIVIFVVLGGVLGYFAIRSNWPAIEAKLKAMASDGVTEIMANGIRDTDLTDEDKAALIARIELMGEEFKAERLTFDDIEAIGKVLAESPVLPVGMVAGMNKAYIDSSDLTDDEKSAARRLNDRLARGLYDRRIKPEELQPVLDPISEPGKKSMQIERDSDGNPTGLDINLRPPEMVSADDLRAYMAQAESLLEQKAIADEPFEIDLIEEFDKAVESAIGRRLVPDEEAGENQNATDSATEAGSG